ncbi:MAG: hypothetical protein Q7I99_02680, partial [Acholeplasmataceae bacterium]|nr:hypothetical protein [Acholeplasmataceae bacterium]
WFEKFEYFDILKKALDKSSIDVIREYILNIISDDIKSNYYNLKSSSNLLKIFSLISPMKVVEFYETIENYETKLLPYFEIDILLGEEKYNHNLLLILLILEKMKFLNKESIVNSLEVLTYISQNLSYEHDFDLALIDFYTNYDPKFSLVYALVLDVFDERIKNIQELIDKRKINESQDFFLKKFFSSANELYPMPVYYHFNNYVTTYLKIVGLQQFENFNGIEIPLEKSSRTSEFQKIMNQDLVGWRKIPSVNNVNTIVMNELYFFIQELFSNYPFELLSLDYDAVKKTLLFKMVDKINENKLHFIPFKLAESIVELRKYSYKLADRIENKSEHYVSKVLYPDTLVLFEDVLRYYDFDSYHINNDSSSTVSISHKNIQIKDKNYHDNEETEVIIMVKSNVNKDVIKVTFDDYLSTTYNKRKKT